jgi:hypothetical protein
MLKNLSLTLNKYGGLNSYDLLKALAIITMIIDHIGLLFLQDIEMLRAIGRISLPLFAFCVGYNQKYSFDKTLAVLAVISCLASLVLWPHLKYFIRGSILKASILPSIIIIRISMQFLSKILNDYSAPIVIIILWALLDWSYGLFQYGTLGIIIAICGYLCALPNKLHFYKVFLAANLLLYFVCQGVMFGFNQKELVVLLMEYLLLMVLFANFSIKPIKIYHKFTLSLLFLSRYSLIIYLICVFQ